MYSMHRRPSTVRHRRRWVSGGRAKQQLRWSALYLVRQLPMQRLTRPRAVVGVGASGAAPELVPTCLRSAASIVRAKPQLVLLRPGSDAPRCKPLHHEPVRRMCHGGRHVVTDIAEKEASGSRNIPTVVVQQGKGCMRGFGNGG